MKTIQKRLVVLLLAAILCFPVMSIRADATDTASAMADGGMSHSIALSADGTVYAWGSNAQMQLGFSNSSEEQKTPRQIEGLSNMVAVAAGHYFSAALRFDGTVYTWGDGIQSSPTPVPGLSGVVAIAAGQSELLALDRNGDVWQWSLGGTPARVQGISNIAAIDAGGGHYLALTFSGDVYAWGDNGYGQLGTGDTAYGAAPRKVDLYNIIDIAAGQSHSLAAAFDGTVYAWGSNTYGQLGDGTTVNSSVPVQVKTVKKAVQVSAGIDMSMARTSDNKLYAWGYGEYGQLGSGSASLSQSNPQSVSTVPSQPVYIACGAHHNLCVTQNGNLYTWGRNNRYQLGSLQNSNITSPRIISSFKADAEGSYQTNALNSASSWALPELEPLYSKDLISPIIWQNFQDGITRAEFAHVLVTIYEKVKNTTASTKAVDFTDINGLIFETDIIKAYNLGITSGTSTTTFSPNNILNREQAVKMLCTFLSKMRSITIPERVTSMTYYTDVTSISDWALPYVAYAYNENIMRGYGTTFAPGDNLTREQALLIVGRVVERFNWG